LMTSLLPCLNDFDRSSVDLTAARVAVNIAVFIVVLCLTALR
jgi:hypothetical protein